MRGPIIGGVCYLVFAFVPMFIGVSAFLIMPEAAATLLKEDAQKILPTLVMEHMPVWLRVLFFGALLSAIMSTASATLLAPSTTFVENILKNFVPLSDRKELKAMRITLVVFAACVLAYSIATQGTPIYDQVPRPTSSRSWARFGRWCAACTGSVRPRRARSGRSCSAWGRGC